MRRFDKIVIVNRGEPAMRFIVAAREYAEERGERLTTVALYTDPDRHAMFVREADEAYHLGPAHIPDASGGRISSYLDHDTLARALRATGADAVWPGWGFVAEQAEFADLCDRLGVTFIGPSGDMMRALGDKIASKRAAERAEVPITPWSGGSVASLEDARAIAERVGYPLLIKATAGGGGRGIRPVHGPAELERAFVEARSEAAKAFGDATVFFEQKLTAARHVEVQVIADEHGGVWTLGVRDCSIQRRHQKVLEETPSPALDASLAREIEDAAARLVRTIGYRNAGTVEFLFDPVRRRFTFLEVNARLQVEHPVTELVTGVDLVKLQIHVARGGRLPDERPELRGHAIEARLTAEDVEEGFAPAPGAVERLRFASGPGLRVDTGIAEGDLIPAEFDSMIAKVIAWGHTRDEAIARLRRGLLESSVAIRGGTCNKGFLIGLLDDPDIRRGDFDIGWLDRAVADRRHLARQHAEVALVHAAIECYDAELAVERTQFYRAASRGRPRVGDGGPRTFELGHRGLAYELRVSRTGRHHYRVDVEGHRIEVERQRFDAAEQRLRIGASRYRVQAQDQGASLQIEVDGSPHRVTRDRGGILRAGSPAIVVSVLVEPGAHVDRGDRVAVLEAMKLEMAVEARFAGTVREVMVQAGVQVDPGAPLLLIEPDGGSRETVVGQRLRFAVLAGPPDRQRNLGVDTLRELGCLLRGYDADRATLLRSLRSDPQIAASAPPTDRARLALEDKVLRLFVDTCSLFRRHTGLEDHEDFGKHTTEEYLFTLLRDLSGQGFELLPPPFLAKVERAVSHYGITELEPGSALEEPLYRICLAHQQEDGYLGPLLALLQSRLDHLEALRPVLEPTFRVLLSELIAESQGRYPAIHTVARELRFYLYDKPLHDDSARRALDRAASALAYLASHPEAPDRDRYVEEVVDCPHVIKGFLSRRLPESGRYERHAMLEVLVKRYYRAAALRELEVFDTGGFDLATARYDYNGAVIQLIATHVAEAELPAAMQVIRDHIAGVPAECEIAIDLYLWRSQDLDPPDHSAAALLGLLREAALPRPPRRVVAALSGRETALFTGGVQYFTFRPADTGALTEQLVYRGLHPLLSGRLQLWRLKNFELERLESSEEIYLYRLVGRDNRKDERLVALGEIRDLTPIRDEAGTIVALPGLERMLSEALAAIRQVQGARSDRDQLHWNRVHLTSWPPLDLTPDEINRMIHRLAPETAGLGLERVIVQGRFRSPSTGELEDKLLDVSNPGEGGLSIRFRDPPTEPMQPLGAYEQNVIQLRRRGLVYPYELLRMIAPTREGGVTGAFPPGEFIEHELVGSRLEPVNRPPGGNPCNIVAGLVRSFTVNYPEGIERVALLGEPSQGMGSLAEPECRRIIAALDLAAERKLPVEWYAVSAGAKISMASGTENMDWIAAVLRRIVEFTQLGGEINVVVCGINVGAQPYFNAEATMLMHTKGILIMIPGGAMVLTGKTALDYSGGVSAEDNEGIGGYERIMGPNGQAQYAARDIGDACHILLRHYDHTYVVPGERFPRRADTTDPIDRDVCDAPHGPSGGSSFDRVGDVFDDATNPGRKRPFDIRKVMQATIDSDHPALERWYGMRHADTAVVWDARIGGYPVCLLGIQSHPVPRLGFVPADGPTAWTAGTLFPASSKKIARAINGASGNRPVAVLANLSGFDGSPESMRNWQLEWGAEIGRAVVNFRGPIVFCVVSRYHGGAFVVFSAALNPRLEIAALEGTYASVIGGAPAAAVVFAGEVNKRTAADPRVAELASLIQTARGAERGALRAQLERVQAEVHTEKLRQVADEFDSVHSVQRAQQVGSVHTIIPPARLRPYLVHAIARGIAAEPETAR